MVLEDTLQEDDQPHVFDWGKALAANYGTADEDDFEKPKKKANKASSTCT